MTKGQRTLVGIAGAFIASLLMWCLIAQVSAQTQNAAPAPSWFLVQFNQPDQVDAECGRITEGRLQNVRACSNSGMLIARNPCLYRSESYARDLCHEYTCHILTGRADHTDPRCRP